MTWDNSLHLWASVSSSIQWETGPKVFQGPCRTDSLGSGISRSLSRRDRTHSQVINEAFNYSNTHVTGLSKEEIPKGWCRYGGLPGGDES